jgi:hypothetical protein
MTEIGSLAGGTRQEERRTYQTKDRKTVEYVLASSDEATFLGSYSIGTSLSDGLYLESIDLRNFKGVTRATLTYVTEEELVNLRYGGTGTSKASDSNGVELPIELNGNHSKSWETTKPGVTSFIAPQPTYTYTQIVSNFTFSESNIVENVGTIDSPTGMSSPSANKWLKTSKTVTPQGDKYQITETWQYSASGWDTDIYS